MLVYHRKVGGSRLLDDGIDGFRTDKLHAMPHLKLTLLNFSPIAFLSVYFSIHACTSINNI